MKTKHFFTGILIAGVIINSCSLPSGIEIKTKSSMSLPVKSGTANLGAIFSDAIKESFSDGSTYDCPKAESLTFLVHFAGDDKSPLSRRSSSASRSVARGPSANVARSENASEATSLDDYIDGFDFTGVQAWFHVSSGNNVTLNKFEPTSEVTVTYTKADGSSVSDLVLENTPITVQPAPVDTSGFLHGNTEVCDLEAFLVDPPSPDEIKILPFPDRGREISDKIQDLMNIHPFPQNLKFTCTLNAGDPSGGGLSDITAFDTAKDDPDNPLVVELFIWVPLEFTAVKDDAALKFPEMFAKGEDLFGRDSDDDDSLLDMIASLKLEIKLNRDTFAEGTMNISADGKLLGPNPPPPLNGESLVFDMSNEDIELIKKTVPFAPDIGIEFKKDKKLKIPENLETTSIDFFADIDYTIEL
jgi:hypothetical protein